MVSFVESVRDFWFAQYDWFVISAAQLRGWMRGQWDIPLHDTFFFFFPSFPFHFLSHSRFMTGEKIKEKTNANSKPRECSWLYFSSPNKLPDQVHLAQSTNQMRNVNPLPTSITLVGKMTFICLTWSCIKIRYEL